MVCFSLHFSQLSELQVIGKARRNGEWLMRHMSAHTGLRAFPCPMSACSKSYDSADELAVHMQNHLDTPKRASTVPLSLRSRTMLSVSKI